MDKIKMYQIQLYDYTCSPICDGVIQFFVDNLDDFEKNWLPYMKEDKERAKRYFRSKAGEIVTDYYTDSPELNIVQEKEARIIAEKTYTESNVIKNVENFYECLSSYHIDKITYYIRYVKIDDKWLKLCKFDIEGICRDEGEPKWIGEKAEKYKKIGLNACKHLVNKKYLPAYHVYEDGINVAQYIPRYSYASVFGNPFINLDEKILYSDDTNDYSDVKANMFVWYVVNWFKDEKELVRNIEHYKLDRKETQILLENFPGEAG